MLSKIILPKKKNKEHYFPHLKRKNTFNITYGLNVIIGPNASGKTTFLNTIRHLDYAEGTEYTHGFYKCTIYAPVDCEYNTMAYFNESTPIKKCNILKYNPAKYSAESDKKMALDTLPMDTFMSIHMFRQSSAQCAAFYFEDFFNEYKDIIGTEDCIITADEPENSNDLITLGYLIHAFKNWTSHNPKLQILIATHHPAFVKAADNVIELEHHYKDKLIHNWRLLLNSFDEKK